MMNNYNSKNTTGFTQWSSVLLESVSKKTMKGKNEEGKETKKEKEDDLFLHSFLNYFFNKQNIIDMDSVVSTQYMWLVGKWINDARQWGTSTEERALYEFNARNQLTLWGPAVCPPLPPHPLPHSCPSPSCLFLLHLLIVTTDVGPSRLCCQTLGRPRERFLLPPLAPLHLPPRHLSSKGHPSRL